MATEQHHIAGTEGRLHLETSKPDAPRYTAVLVHGYAEHLGRYQHVVAALVNNGAAVFAVDLAGHGRSEGERGLVTDLERSVDDVARIVARAREEYPELPLVMIGHSMGGIVATRFAQRHGDDLAALVLSSPAFGGNPGILGLVALPEIPDVPIDPDWLSRDAEVGRAYMEDPLVYHGPFQRPTLESLVASVDNVAQGGSLGTLPTLWIHGEADPLAPLTQAREAVERIRGSQLEERIYPEARHELLNELNRDEVIAGVISFLDRTAVAAGVPASG